MNSLHALKSCVQSSRRTSRKFSGFSAPTFSTHGASRNSFWKPLHSTRKPQRFDVEVCETPCFAMQICETFRFYNVINNYKRRKIATFRAVSRVKDTADILISRRLELSRKPLLVIRNVEISCNSGPAAAYFNLGFFLSLRRL